MSDKHFGIAGAWTKALDDGYGIDVIFLDYRKAMIVFRTLV